MKFKEGDEVVIKTTLSGFYNVGDVATIILVEEYRGGMYRLRFSPSMTTWAAEDMIEYQTKLAKLLSGVE